MVNEVEIVPTKTIEGKGEYEIYYTTDGSDPDRSSIKYSKALKLDQPGVIKARIYQKGLSDELASNVKVQHCEEPKGTIYMDELYPTEIVAHNGLKMNHNYGFSNRVILGDKRYEHSVMACPTGKDKMSKLVYDIAFIDDKITFKSDFGLDAATKFGSVEFIVKVKKDGKEKQLFKSPLMNKTGAFKSVELDVTGCDELILIATDGGNGPAGDHSAWGAARLEIK